MGENKGPTNLISTRFWLDDKKKEVLNATGRIVELVSQCTHNLAGCACNVEILKNVHHVINVASYLEPYTTNRRLVASLRFASLHFSIDYLMSASRLKLFCATANGISVDAVSRPYWNLFGVKVPSPIGSAGMFFRRHRD